MNIVKNVKDAKVRDNTEVPREKKNGGTGFKSKGKYWSKVPNALRRINTQRHLQFLERKGKTHCGKEGCKYCPPLADLKAPCPATPAPTNSGPSDQGFTKRKYVFRGYMSDEEFTEVKPNPMHQEPKFKNKIEEYLWRSKKN